MLEAALFWLAVLTLPVVVSFGLRIILGNRQIRRLVDVEPASDDLLPRISIIVAARNEARDIEPALRSLLALDYGPLEIIAVNDRSTDRTGEIMNQLAGDSDRLRIVHIDELPGGWLGKNHALQQGAERAAGDWLLFTDADVVMDPTVLKRAIRYATEQRIDHLPVLPCIRMPSWFLEAFVVTFGVYFTAFLRPWKAKDPKSRCHVGIGAFNLIRVEVYDQIGRHEAIAMRPDDDLKLGKLVKKNGFRQELLYSGEIMHVPWYNSLGEVIVGLEKNAFSGVDYRVWLIVVSSLVALTMHVWPFIGVCVTTGTTQILNAVIVACLLVIAATSARLGGLRPSCAIAFPLTVLVFVYIQWRSMLLTFWNNGIRWRDTHYPLAELKANKV